MRPAPQEFSAATLPTCSTSSRPRGPCISRRWGFHIRAVRLADHGACLEVSYPGETNVAPPDRRQRLADVVDLGRNQECARSQRFFMADVARLQRMADWETGGAGASSAAGYRKSRNQTRRKRRRLKSGKNGNDGFALRAHYRKAASRLDCSVITRRRTHVATLPFARYSRKLLIPILQFCVE